MWPNLNKIEIKLYIGLLPNWNTWSWPTGEMVDFVGGADNPKIKPPKLRWAYLGLKVLTNIQIIKFCFYYKFKFCFPEILRVVGGADTPKIKPTKLSWA